MKEMLSINRFGKSILLAVVSLGGLLFLLSTGMISITSKAPKLTPPEFLEEYLKNESFLNQTGWGFYAVQTKESKLHAYLVFPPPKEGVTRMAPVESELRRLCPDTKWHTFWSDTDLGSIELVLMKNVQADKGKAERLLQITCESNFNLAEFEKTTLN